MLTGNVPFAKPTPHAVLLAHVMEEPPAMSAVGIVTPPEVEAVVLKSMAKDPSDRYEWASDMVNDLEMAITATDLGVLDYESALGVESSASPVADAGSAATAPPARPSAPAAAPPDSQATPPLPPVEPARAAPSTPGIIPALEPKPRRRTRRWWLWPLVSVLVLGTLVALTFACAVGIELYRRLAQETNTPTVIVPPTSTLPPVSTLPPASTLPPLGKPTTGPDITLSIDALLYEEDFSAPGTEWEISENEQAQYRIDGGAYSIEVFQSNWIAWNLIGQEFADFDLEFEVALVEGDPYNDAGLLFRFQDSDNYYEVDINGEGSFSVGKEVDNEWIQIVEWTSDPAISTFGRVNRLRLVAVGSEFSLYINDEFMVEFDDSTFASGGIGPVVTAYDEPPARATFDNITIWEIDNQQ
jgi:hypothetical protein